MAESPSLASEKPQIDKVEFGLLITDTTQSDPINPTSQIVEIQPLESSESAPDIESGSPMAEVVEEETAASDEEMELRNAIERDLCQLTIEQAEIEQAEIEGGRQRLENVNDDEGSDLGTAKKGDENVEKDGKEDSESGEDENENEGADEENVASQSGDGVMKFGRYNQSNNRRKNNYPMRPDAEDCAFYMKFGSCKFGLNCKFNHPPRRKSQGVKERANHREENSERAGQTECKYYQTSGGCKYGKDCKYSHGSDNSSTPNIPELNFLGLPMRPGQKECPFYMRNGSCKYGSNCRFHHPEPVAIGGGSPSRYGNGGSLPSQLVSSSSASSWSSPRAFNETSPFVPVIFPPAQGAPTSNQDWNGYQAATFPTSERSLPTPPAFAINNLPTEINFPMHHRQDIMVEEYPQRPGEQECSFFLKTGDCKFKSNCKFHHPKDRVPKGKSNSSYALNDKGLPLRPDQPICTHYNRYGICKYGPACKYDHPPNISILPNPFDQSPFGTSKIDGAVALGKGNES